MSWTECEDQERVVEILKGSIQHERIAHAYLFTGPRGVGKKKVAVQFAKTLFCQEMTEDSCEKCSNCKRINGGNHPDVHVLTPDGVSIKIEQVRSLQKEFSYRSVESNRKVYIVERAETMTVHAANSLLKFLEEPASDITAILLAESTHAMLPTILSRCQMITFHPLPPNKIVEILIAEGESEPAARVISHLTAGLEEARKLCQSEWFAQLRSQVVQLSQDILDRGSYALLSVQDKILSLDKSKEDVQLLLDLYMIWLRDLMLWQSGRQKEIANIDQKDILAKQAMQWGGKHLVHNMELVLETKRRLEQNANPQLSVERLVLELQEG